MNAEEAQLLHPILQKTSHQYFPHTHRHLSGSLRHRDFDLLARILPDLIRKDLFGQARKSSRAQCVKRTLGCPAMEEVDARNHSRNWWTSSVELVRQQAGFLSHVVQQYTDYLEPGDRARFQAGQDEVVHRNQSDYHQYWGENVAG